jgi:phosphoribosylformylglycinamidine synthase
MAFAGGVGAEVSLRDVPCDDDAAHDAALLFAESPSRFLLEIEPRFYNDVGELFGGLPLGRLGETREPADGAAARLTITGLDGSTVVDSALSALEEAWRRPLDW